MARRPFTALLACVLAMVGLALPMTAHAREPLHLRVYVDPVFSPNGDGRHDTAAIRFTISERADVRIVIGDDRGVDMANVHLDGLAPGKHVWRWDGRYRGERLTDDSYFVGVRAKAASGTKFANGHVEIDTDESGHLVTTRPTIYPRATVVNDSVRIQYVPRGFVGLDPDALLGDARFAVLDDRGHVVWRAGHRNTQSPQFVWHGDTENGKTATPGRYVARVTYVDAAGNRVVRRTPVRVSGKQLRAVVETRTLPASEWPSRPLEGLFACAPVGRPTASERFPGGLSFHPVTNPCGETYLGFAATAPTRAGNNDRYRVTVTGGPTTPGGADVGELLPDVGRVVVTGDGSFVSAWTRTRFSAPDVDRPAVWSFRTTDPNAYDVASFTVEYRSYVPVS